MNYMGQHGKKNYLKLNNMQFNWLNKINRVRGEKFSRSKYLRLDKNERVTDFSNKFVKQIKSRINSFHLSAYPEVEKIYDLLSKTLKLPKEMIVLTSGSDMAIKLCFELFAGKNKEVITIHPTFGMVNVYADLFRVKQKKIGYNKKLELEAEKLIRNINKKTSLIIIANPNSPTGTIINKKSFIQIIKKAYRLKVPILIDEAYFGFYGNSYINFVKKFKNVIIVRTFSKIFGLAGLRMGYIVADKKIAKNLFKFKPMYEINSLGCLILELILKNKKIFNKYLNEVNLGKKFFISELKKMNIANLKTYANFIHIDLGKNKNLFTNLLKQKNILVRKGPEVRTYENYLRITLAPKNEMKRIINYLKKIK